MFWHVRRPRRRPTPAARSSFRPCLQVLEGRQLPSVSVMALTNTGAPTLLVRADGANDTVTIVDNSMTGTTTVVADGKTKAFQHQFALFDLELLSKKDAVSFNLVGVYSQRHADVEVRLGKGENHFTFNPNQTGITNHSNVTLDILGHNGNDFVNLNYGQILESSVSVLASQLGGSKARANPADVRSSITFGVGKTGIRNSSVDVAIGLGHGNNNFAFNYGADLGHLLGTGAAAASDFGPATFNVSITGSDRRQDIDNVTLLATGEVNTGSTLVWNTQFLAGKNSFKAVFDANSFQIDDDGGAFINGPQPGSTAPHSGGAAHFNIHAGTGNDSISFQTIHQDHTVELSGLFDINVFGGSGKNNVMLDFGGAGFTDDDPFEVAATNRAFRLRVIGGSGDDAIETNLANAAKATFAFDVKILGGAGKNDIMFAGTNPAGGTPTFGPAGSVFIDGGFSNHNDVDVFGNFLVEVLNGDS